MVSDKSLEISLRVRGLDLESDSSDMKPCLWPTSKPGGVILAVRNTSVLLTSFAQEGP